MDIFNQILLTDVPAEARRDSRLVSNIIFSQNFICLSVCFNSFETARAPKSIPSTVDCFKESSEENRAFQFRNDVIRINHTLPTLISIATSLTDVRYSLVWRESKSMYCSSIIWF